MKFHYDLAGIFQFKKDMLTENVRHYINLCRKKEIHIPDEVFGFKNVFIWGIGAFAENLLYGGFFDGVENLFLLDVDLSKQGKIICGRTIYSPEKLKEYNDEDVAVVITSVLYEDKIKEALKLIGFSGRCFTVI